VTLLGQGVGLGDPQRSLPTLTMLGSCDQRASLIPVSFDRFCLPLRAGLRSLPAERVFLSILFSGGAEGQGFSSGVSLCRASRRGFHWVSAGPRLFGWKKRVWPRTRSQARGAALDQPGWVPEVGELRRGRGSLLRAGEASNALSLFQASLTGVPPGTAWKISAGSFSVALTLEAWAR